MPMPNTAKSRIPFAGGDRRHRAIQHVEQAADILFVIPMSPRKYQPEPISSIGAIGGKSWGISAALTAVRQQHRMPANARLHAAHDLVLSSQGAAASRRRVVRPIEANMAANV